MGSTATARRRTTQRRRPEVAIAGTSTQLRDFLNALDSSVRTGRYEILGRVAVMQTDRGSIEYRGTGPMLAKQLDDDGNATGQLLCLNEWPGALPDLRDSIGKPCSSCLATCDECEAGKRPCINCGGNGKTFIKRIECPDCAAKIGRFDINCETCRGSGAVVDPQDCKACEGSGKIACTLCLGTGKMSTGKKDGSTERGATECEACEGNKREATMKPQPFINFLHGRLENMPALGPIRKMVLQNATPDPDKLMLVIDVMPDVEGNLTVMLLKDVKAGSPMYLYGGRVQVA
ncbi:MAG: hypothetical protein JWO13_826 [Acidobacteriales bacterium]|nr:hypothetical protein [Terriglobales bacterium]